MEAKWIICRKVNGDLFVSGSSPIKPDLPSENFVVYPWAPDICGGYPKIHKTSSEKQRKSEFYGDAVDDDPPFVLPAGITYKELRRSAYRLELDELALAYRASLDDGDPDDETNSDRVAYFTKRAEIKALYPKP